MVAPVRSPAVAGVGGLALVGVIWLSTAFLQVLPHNTLAGYPRQITVDRIRWRIWLLTTSFGDVEALASTDR